MDALHGACKRRPTTVLVTRPARLRDLRKGSADPVSTTCLDARLGKYA